MSSSIPSIKIIECCGIYLSYIALGFFIGVMGPTIQDLGRVTGSSVAGLAWIFTWRSIGYLFGAASIGPFTSKYTRPTLYLASLLPAACSVLLMPFATSLYTLLAICGLGGIFFGAMDTMSNVFIIEIIGSEDCPPFLNALHFFFAVGAFIAPLSVQSFLSSPDLSQAANPAFAWSYYLCALTLLPAIAYNLLAPFLLDLSAHSPAAVSKGEYEFIPSKNSSTSTSTSSSSSTDGPATPDAVEDGCAAYTDRARHVFTPSQSSQAEPKEAGTDFSYLELSPASASTPASCLENDNDKGTLAALSYQSSPVMPFSASPKLTHRSSSKTAELPLPSFASPLPPTSSSPSSSLTPEQYKVVMVLFTALFLFLNVGTEHGFASYIFTYGVSPQLQMTAVDAANLTSMYWGGFVLGRLLAIPISVYIPPTVVLLIDILGCQVSLLFLFFFPTNATVFMLSSLGIGMFMASAYPTAITVVSQHIHVDSTATTGFLTGSSFGQMLMPLVIGILFDDSLVGPMALVYTLITTLSSCTLVYFAMVWYTHDHPLSNKTQKAKRESLGKPAPAAVVSSVHAH